MALLYDLGEISEHIRLYAIAVFLILVLASFVAFLLSSGLRAIIAGPILELVNATRSVSRIRDYGIRARKVSGDELGALADGFNEMLTQIQSQDNEVRKALAAQEAALRESMEVGESLRTTLASIGDAVISTDAQGRVVFVNAVAQNLLADSRVAGPGQITAAAVGGVREQELRLCLPGRLPGERGVKAPDSQRRQGRQRQRRIREIPG